MYYLKENTSLDQFLGWPRLAGLGLSRWNRLKTGTAQAASRHIRLSYLLLHCMCRPRLQEAGGETHFPVVHQLQNSTTASNGATQLKKKTTKKEETRRKKPITTQPGTKTSPAEILHKETQIRSICKASFRRREHKPNGVQEKALAPLGWDSSVQEGPQLSRVTNSTSRAYLVKGLSYKLKGMD